MHSMFEIQKTMRMIQFPSYLVVYKILSRKPEVGVQEMRRIRQQLKFDVKTVDQDKCIIDTIPEGWSVIT